MNKPCIDLRGNPCEDKYQENPTDWGFWTGVAAVGGLILIMATRKKNKPATTAANLTAAKGLAQQNTP